MAGDDFGGEQDEVRWRAAPLADLDEDGLDRAVREAERQAHVLQNDHERMRRIVSAYFTRPDPLIDDIAANNAMAAAFAVRYPESVAAPLQHDLMHHGGTRAAKWFEPIRAACVHAVTFHPITRAAVEYADARAQFGSGEEVSRASGRLRGAVDRAGL